MRKTLLLGVAICCAAGGWAGTRIGIIGLDTSHAIEFTKMLNVVKDDPAFEGFRVTAAYTYGSLDIVTSTNRYPAYTKQMKEMGVEIVPSVADLLGKTDAILLETNDGRRHYEQALEVFKSGKRVFIDKPVAAQLPDVVRILAAAKESHAQFFTSSALRYVKNAQAARAGTLGKVLGADTYTPCTLEPSHSRFYWYGIHGVEPLFTIMGRGCRQVACASQPDADVAVGTWADGRVGVVRGMRGKGATYGGFIFTDKGVVPMGGYEGYKELLLNILTFFKTGAAPVDADETLEIFAFMEAAAESARRGGTPVTLEEVLAKAKAEASK
jgi:hypothetical protein